ncbi:MAG: FAD-dependent oxidoreductase, partial [Nocardioides sp.]|nr:FAD-dependent oxidoreductase [Nocardioides sp.]
MQQYDVVVVGSGGGALAGAAVAAKAGLSVLVVEKTDLIGGTSAYSGGACWLPGSQVQQRAGIPDSTESAQLYLDAILSPTSADPQQGLQKDRVEAFLAHAPVLVAELEADEGVDFEWLPFPEYYDAPGRVPFGRSIQPTNIKRGELPPEVAALVRPPVERDRAGEPGRNTLSGGQSLIARLASVVVREGGEIRTNLPVTGLLTDDSGRVTGVAAMTPEGP